MASKTSAGKGKKKDRKNSDSPDIAPKSAKKKISISGGRIVDLEAQQAAEIDPEDQVTVLILLYSLYAEFMICKRAHIEGLIKLISCII